jgi:hypothetical protein
VTLTDRDRKIAVILVPVLVLAAYWFLVLSPKRQETSRLGDQLTQAQSDRDQARGDLQQVQSARSSFASGLASLVKVGKAVPTSVDMPSLIVQLDRAAKGTGIRFQEIKAGERTAAPTASSSSGGSSSSSGSSSSGSSSSGSSGSTPAAAPGGEQAGTGPGKAAEKAGEAKQTADNSAAAAGGESSTSGSSPQAASSGSSAPGLDTVPLDFTFKGSFFDLADFLHKLKRFVRVANGRLDVRGRLMTVDGFTLQATDFPAITAHVQGTVYLAPKEEGPTAGATPQGPAAAGGQQAAPSSGASSSSPTTSTTPGAAR